MKDAYTKTITACLTELKSQQEGLTTAQAQINLQSFGENQLPEEKIPPVWLIFLQQFMSPLIYILLVAGIITIFMQQYSGAIFIFAVLLVNAIIGTIQEYSANNSAAALKKMTTSFAQIRRDGVVEEINATQLVPGDIVLLESGNKVPADMRLIHSSSLKVDESLLTGESNEVIKDAEKILQEGASTSDQVNMAFAGTIITHGRAEGVITTTGLRTKMGEIAKHITEKSKVKSPLIIRMERFTLRISLLVGALVIVIAAVLYKQGHPPEHIFLIAVGLAVAAIPEGLPVTLTIALAIGVRRMAKRNVIVRKLVAVESLGSCTLIASDKTGTLTRNKMTAEHLILPSGEHYTVTSGKTVADGYIKKRDNNQ